MAKPSGQKRRPPARGTAARRRGGGAPRRATNQELLRRRRAPVSGPERLIGRAGSRITSLSVATGFPTWVLPTGAVVWVCVLLLWAAGAVAGSFAFFLGALLSAAIATGWIIAVVAKGKDGLRAARAGVLVALATFVPVVFDPHTGDVYNLPKYTLVVVGALALAGFWVVAAVHRRPLPFWRNGLQWLVGLIVAWTALSALAGVDTHVGLLGNYGSYDGFFLAAALAVVAMVAAEAFDVADVRKVLAALGLAGGGVVLLYGLIQLHDVEFHGSKAWDFIHYQTSSFAGNIFSAFGNPNHLGAYLAMIFPIVVAFGLGAKRWAWRTVGAVVGLVLLVELVRTAARGAWVGVIIAALLLAVFLAPELRQKALVVASTTFAIVAVGIAGMAAFGHHFLNQPLSSLFQSGGTTSIEQRLLIWRTALHIALLNPVAGIGPDAFALVYPRYQSAAWVKGLGPDYLVNGAHDIVMNVLADQGFVGLALLLALLAAIALRSAGAWRRCRRTERRDNFDAAAKERARSIRVTLGVVSASITAYLVQALFNVQQVGLSFIFWLLVGLLAVLTRGAGVPDTLRPAQLVSAGQGLDPGLVAHRGGTGQPRQADAPVPLAKPRRSGTFVLFVPWQTGLAAFLVVVVALVAALGADGPYRADHAYWAAYSSLKEAPAPGSSSQQSTEVGPVYFSDIQHAAALNSWEGTYPEDEGTVLTNLASSASTKADVLSDLTRARKLFAEAVAREPLWGQYSASEADVDGYLSEQQPAKAHAYLAAAASLARQAIRDDPRDPTYRALLEQSLAAEHPQKATKKT